MCVNFDFRLIFHHLWLAVVVASFATTSSKIEANNAPVGLPLIRNYSAKDYNFHPQNWAIAQDSRGILYVANTQGLLEFDGTTWRKHHLTDANSIASLKMGNDDRLYIGGRGDFGYLDFDPLTGYRFQSYAELLPEEQKQLISIIWHIAVEGDTVYFRSNHAIFKVTNGTIEVLEGNFGIMEQVGDRIFVLQKGKPLQQLTNGKLTSIEVTGADALIDSRLYSILQWDENGTYLLITRDRGCFLFNETTGIQRFETEADAFLAKHRFYRGTVVWNENQRWFALSTYNNGVIVIDQTGAIQQVINSEAGLIDNKTHYPFQDASGALWISTNEGISRVDFPSAFSAFDQKLGLDGLPQTIKKFEDRLFVGTHQGLFQLDPPKTDSETPWFQFTRFRDFDSESIEKHTSEVWAMETHDQFLWVGDSRYLNQIQNGKTIRSFDCGNSVYSILPLQRGDVILLGTYTGLFVLKKENGVWTLIGKLEPSINTVWSMVEDRDGNIWIGTPNSGVGRLRNLDAKNLKADLSFYRSSQGIPESWLHVSKLGGNVVVMPEKGLYGYDPIHDRFAPHPLASGLGIGPDEQISMLTEGNDGSLWAMKGADKGGIIHAIPSPDGSYHLETKPFTRLDDVNSLLDIELEPNHPQEAWFATREGTIFHYTKTQSSHKPPPIETAVRSVEILDTDIQVWFGDTKTPGSIPRLSSDENSLRFHFSAIDFVQPEQIQYRVKLAGYQDKWGPWSRDRYKDYTKLPGGTYVFQVQAKRLNGDISESMPLQISVSTAWYKTWWAYGLYTISVFVCIAFFVKWRIRELERKAKELEAIVEARTEKISKQAEELKEMDRIKTRFFANISHEFRTPLTLILGPTEKLLQSSEAHPPEIHRQLNIVQRNAHRLKRLIDQLLYFSKVEANQLRLQVQKGNLSHFLEQTVDMFASAAEQQTISLTYESNNPLESADYFDPDVLEKIIYNLLSNAIKFTPKGGTIAVALSGGPNAKITVTDNGPGIEAEQLPYIFNRFYQNEVSKNNFQQGTGIGLALTKELVELHHGSIEVESQKEKGTTFIVEIPVDRGKFTDDEIVDSDWRMNPETAKRLGSDESEIHHLSQAKPTDENEKRILIVEDHANVRAFISEQLLNDYQILEASNGKTGLEIAKETVPDLIISDVMMPEMDGFEFCKQVKTTELISHIPVILLTARAGEESRIEGWEIGADDYLTKPFNSKELVVRIRKRIEQRELLRERFRKEGMFALKEEHLPSAEETFIKKLVEAVEENLEDESFGVDALGKIVGLGRRQLLRKMQATTGQTAIAFIRTARLRRAKHYIETRALSSITEIAYAVGFSSLSYFARMFKEEFGNTPSEQWEKSK